MGDLPAWQPRPGGGQVLAWDADAGEYVPAPGARDFRGPVDPSTVDGITLAAGDIWTPTQEPVT